MNLQWLDIMSHLDCVLRSYIEIVAMFILPNNSLTTDRIALLCSHPRLNHFSPPEMIAYLQESAQIVQKGIDARSADIKRYLPTHEQHKEAIALALSVVAHENCLQRRHTEMVHQMAAVFELSDGDVEELLSLYDLGSP